MLVPRGNHPGPIHAQFWGVQQHVLQMLLAVNRRYPVGHKFLDTTFARCELAPTNLAERFDAVSTLPPAQAAAELQSLVLETYYLVEDYVPGLEPGEVDRWRHYFHYQRPFWESAPPRP